MIDLPPAVDKTSASMTLVLISSQTNVGGALFEMSNCFFVEVEPCSGSAEIKPWSIGKPVCHTAGTVIAAYSEKVG